MSNNASIRTHLSGRYSTFRRYNDGEEVRHNNTNSTRIYTLKTIDIITVDRDQRIIIVGAPKTLLLAEPKRCQSIRRKLNTLLPTLGINLSIISKRKVLYWSDSIPYNGPRQFDLPSWYI